jgi:hypothetical protein
VDLHAIEARAQARKSMTSWADAHQALVDHQPVTTRRGNTCGHCHADWPCSIREAALDELTGAAR